MIKTKQPVVIDARTGESKILFFDNFFEQRDSKQEKVSYLIDVFVEEEINSIKTFKQIMSVPAEYKKSTWLTLFGNLNSFELEEQKDELMIQQISYNSSKYWGLTVEKLEVFIG